MWGFDCVKSKRMCFPWSPETDCHCCAKSCHNVGCKEFFNGKGTCMKFEAEKDMKEALDRVCVVSKKLCRRSKCTFFQFNFDQGYKTCNAIVMHCIYYNAYY